jgi:CBS domain-containing protein
MVRTPVVVAPEAPVHEVVRVMLGHGVAGLPVVDESGRLVGLISQADLLVRLQPERPRRWWTVFADPYGLAREYRLAMGTCAAEIMSREAVTVMPDDVIEVAASLLREASIDLLPVVSGGRLAGTISRSDLLRTLTAPASSAARSDPDLVAEMRARLAREAWATGALNVDAEAGVIALYGLVDGEAQMAALETMARSIAGCRGVENHLVDRRAVPRGI